MSAVLKNTTFRDRAAARKGTVADVKAVEADEVEVENKAVGPAKKAAPKAAAKAKD